MRRGGSRVVDVAKGGGLVVVKEAARREARENEWTDVAKR